MDVAEHLDEILSPNCPFRMNEAQGCDKLKLCLAQLCGFSLLFVAGRFLRTLGSVFLTIE